MKELLKNKLKLGIFMSIILIGVFAVASKVNLPRYFTNIANAETEDEIENEHEEEDRESNDDRHEESESFIQTTETNTETAPVVLRYVNIVDPGFDVDTDNDDLVDAIDPNPTVPQTEFFTDIDGDGVANAYDSHPGEDDFDYISFEDSDHNGILDNLE